MTLISNFFPDQHDRPGRPRNSASDQQQVLFRVDLANAQVLDRSAFDPHMTGHAGALDDARRIGRSPDGARSAVEHRTVCRASAAEAVALDESGESSPLT